eukprot:scaffold236_cov245-Amphora_coffeaeformis.AAC.3
MPTIHSHEEEGRSGGTIGGGEVVVTSTDGEVASSSCEPNDDAAHYTDSEAGYENARPEAALVYSTTAIETGGTTSAAPIQNISITTNRRRQRQGDDAEESSPSPIVANAVLIEGSTDLTLPAAADVEAVPMITTTDNEGGEDQDVHTVRLDSSHIVSIREATQESSGSREKPEFKSVILVNKAAYADFELHQGILGIRLTANTAHNGQPCVSYIDPASPFAQSAVEVGDFLISINNITCQRLDPDKCLAELLSSTSPSTRQLTTTIRFQSVGGNGHRVVTTVEKIFSDASLGISFRVNARGSVLVSKVAPTKILASSLLNADDRIISVNGVDCANVSADANDVARLIRNAPRWVTIVSETSALTGVVIAAGNDDPVGGATSRVARNETESEGNAHNQGAKTCIVVSVTVVFIFLAAVVALTVASGSRSTTTDPYLPPSGPPNGPPPPNDSCFAATPLTINGPAMLGTNQYASALFQNNCGSSFLQENSAVWYSFTASENVTLQVSTCQDQNSFDTWIIVYSGESCESLTCIDENDDGSNVQADGFQTCGSASVITFEATREETYFVVVQGYDNAEGIFAIKVESIGSGVACLCPDVISPAPSPPPQIGAPTGFGPSEAPPNDLCLTADPLTINGPAVLGTNQYASALLERSCAYTEGAAVWYTFTASEDEPLRVSTCESVNTIDTRLTLFSGSCESMTCEGYNDDGSVLNGIIGACNLGSAFIFQATRGETYFAVVQGFSDARGVFAIKVESVDTGIACFCPFVTILDPTPPPQTPTPTLVSFSPSPSV